jgi:hypothetical protein
MRFDDAMPARGIRCGRLAQRADVARALRARRQKV